MIDKIKEHYEKLPENIKSKVLKHQIFKDVVEDEIILFLWFKCDISTQDYTDCVKHFEKLTKIKINTILHAYDASMKVMKFIFGGE